MLYSLFSIRSSPLPACSGGRASSFRMELSCTMHRLIVGITADDLTGAADAAAAFARPGASVGLSLDFRPPTAKDERPVFGVTTNTRGLPAGEVFDLVGDSVGQLRMAGATFIFKKLDSNMRGNVGAELAAVLDTFGGPILLAPAFPAGPGHYQRDRVRR